MFKQIRSMLDQDDLFLAGTIETDETSSAARPRTSTRRPRSGSRRRPSSGWRNAARTCKRGKVIAKVVPDNKATTLIPQAKMKVLPASTVCTDELASYSDRQGLGYTQSLGEPLARRVRERRCPHEHDRRVLVFHGAPSPRVSVVQCSHCGLPVTWQRAARRCAGVPARQARRAQPH
jgi:ISXO2-like transposase domain